MQDWEYSTNEQYFYTTNLIPLAAYLKDTRDIHAEEINYAPIKPQGQVLKWEVFVNLGELGNFFSWDSAKACKSEAAGCIKLQNLKLLWKFSKSVSLNTKQLTNTTGFGPDPMVIEANRWVFINFSGCFCVFNSLWWLDVGFF